MFIMKNAKIKGVLNPALFQYFKHANNLFLCLSLICCSNFETLAQSSQARHANSWTAGGGTGWFSQPPSDKPLGPSDVRCVEGGGNGAWAKFEFPSFNIPSGQVLTGIQVRVKYRAVAKPTVQLTLNNNTIGDIKAMPVQSGGASYCSSTQWRNHEGFIDLWGTSLSASDFNNGVVGFEIIKNKSGTLNIDAVELVAYYCPPPVTQAVITNIAAVPTDICRSGSSTLTLTGTLGDATKWQWYRGSCGGPSAGEGTSITVSPNNTTTYYVHGIGGCATPQTCNSITVNVTRPLISISGATTICAGATATLTADPSGGLGTCSVQWQESPSGTDSWSNIGSNSNTLNVSPTISMDYRAMYSCTETDCITATSNVQKVTVTNVPGIGINGSTGICTGGSTTLTAVVGGSLDCPFVWEESPAGANTWSTVGTDSKTLLVSPTVNMDYRVTYNCAAFGCGNSTSSTHTVTVEAVPFINISGGTTICLGGSVTLNASPLGGAGTCTVEWQESPQGANTWSNIGSNSNTLNVSPSVNMDYRATYSCTGNGCGSATSSIQTILVEADPDISIIGGTTICPGGSATLIASPIDGTGTCTIQWQESPEGTNNWTTTGTNSNTLNVNPASSMDYRAVYSCTGNGCGDATSNTQTIIVGDFIKPSLTCPNNINLPMDAGQCGTTVSWNAPTATDNCDAPFTASQTMGDASGSLFAEGTQTIEYTATDNAGNVENCSFTVTVQPDAQKPALTCPGNVILPMDTGQCGAIANWTAPTATDNCDAPFTASQTMGDASGSLFAEGTQTIEYTATDDEGNVETCTFMVTVQPDAQKPVLTCPNHINRAMDAGQCGAIINWTAPTATDNCDAPFTASQTMGDASGSLFAEGTQTIEYSATDNEGNIETCTFTVTVQADVEKPSLTCPANLEKDMNTGFCGAIVNWTAPIATDNCDGSIPASQTMGDPSGYLFAEGVHTIEYTAVDNEGNTENCTFTVTVLPDGENPVPLCKTETVELNANGTYNLQENDVFNGGTDNCSAVTFVSMSPTSVGCVDVSSSVSVTVTAQDINGNQSNCIATISVIDNNAPVVFCQNQTVQLDSDGNGSIDGSEVDNGSTDHCGIDTRVLDVSDFDCSDIGTNIVTLTVTDVHGNSNYCTATITVEDHIAPDAQCLTTPISAILDTNGEYTINPNDLDSGSTDACGIQNLSASPSILYCSNEGSNTVTLTVTDNHGNSASCTTTVEVDEFYSIDNVIINDETCAGMGDGNLTIEATTGGGQLAYSIDGGLNFQYSNTFASLTSGTYDIVVKLFGVNAICEKASTAVIGASNQAKTWYRDMDGDQCSDGNTLTSCSQPTGYYLATELLAISGDCNDNNPNVHPNATEICDGIDNNCDGQFLGDEIDADGDGYMICEGDCNDSNPAIHPGANEICNGIDDDCDGDIDEGASGGQTWTGNVAFYTQADVDAFSQCYSVIDGSVYIQGSGITNLSNLLNLEEVTGNLTIQYNGLNNMAGLDNLVEVGGTMIIYFNSSLATLDGLDALGAVGGNLMIYYNFALNDGCAIYNLINGGVNGNISIFVNASGCNSAAEINANCSGNSLVANPNKDIIISEDLNRYSTNSLVEEIGMKVYPNPTIGKTAVQFDKRISDGMLQISDMTGRTVFEKAIAEDVDQIQLNLNGWKPGTYFIIVRVDGLFLKVEKLIVIDNR